MKKIEYSLVLDENRRAQLQFPPSITPGAHEVVVFIDEGIGPPATQALEGLPPISVGTWPEGLSLHREDMYGDDGR